MQRVNPFITLPGLLITLVLFAGFGAALWLHGGEAFSPGPLSAIAPRGTLAGGAASHAAIEFKCESCHKPLETTQDVLCLDCHQSVNTEIQTGRGPHSDLPPEMACRICHPEHRGRDFSPALAAAQYYTHTSGGFSLERHRFDFDAAPLPCTACHTALVAGDYSANTQACQDCHAAADPAFNESHTQRFGEQCFACHDGLDTLAEFDHATTDLPLDGAHASLDCLTCHSVDASGKLGTDLDPACATCHTEPPKHAGIFAATCQDCHSSTGWLPATLNGSHFEHEASTQFSLARHTFMPDGSPIVCLHCHTQALESDLGLCTVCHEGLQPEFMTAHLAEFGSACTLCHDGVDRIRDFQHDLVFVLDGRHAELTCANCHQPDPAAPPRFIDLGSACADCHTEPAIHAGVFGLKCEACHSTTAWHPARLTNHTFPLNHGDAPSDCATCHPATYTTYTCYGCHEHQEAEIINKHLEENISTAELANCTKCHADGRKDDD